MRSDTGKHVGKPSLRIDVAQLRRDDETVHGCSALATAIGASEQP